MSASTTTKALPIVRIAKGTFRQAQESKPVYIGLRLSISPPDTSTTPERWAIQGPGKSIVLQILQGKYKCETRKERTYPALAAKGAWPDSCIGLVEFTSTGSLGERVRGEYMSSR